MQTFRGTQGKDMAAKPRREGLEELWSWTSAISVCGINICYPRAHLTATLTAD